MGFQRIQPIYTAELANRGSEYVMPQNVPSNTTITSRLARRLPRLAFRERIKIRRARFYYTRYALYPSPRA